MRFPRLIIGFLVVVIAAVVVFGLWPHRVEKLPIKRLDPWILQTNDPKSLIGFTGLHGTYLGNGYIGARIGPEGVGSYNGEPLPCLMSGLYEGESIKALPNWSDFPLYDSKGKRFVLDTEAPYRQTLNMREGYVETELTLKSGRQRLRGKVTFFIMPSLVTRDLKIEFDVGAIRYDVAPSFSGVIKPGDAGFDASGWTGGSSSTNRGTQGFSSMTPSGRVTLESRLTDGGGGLLGKSITARRGARLVLVKYAAVGQAYHYATSPRSAEHAGKLGFDKLFDLHKKSWRDTWKSDIVVDGDPAAQQAIHAMMFYLLSSASPGRSIPPNGLSGGAWAGHVFWDADMWMFPALLLQHPNEASGIVSYRLRTREGARQNARRRGLSGIELAWESARTGLETAPHPYREERHVTADAAIAASNDPSLPFGTYEGPVRFNKKTGRWYVLGDLRWLPGPEDLLSDTAAYWASRVTYNKAKDRYEILKVVPPDEDAEIVNNSVYTNAAAKRNIELAIEIAKKNRQKYPAKWNDIVKKMYIPFDAKNRRFIEYDGYKGKKTKQADTELLICPLAYPMPEDVKRNTFDFYKTKTDPRGPAMTSSIHAIIAAELGRPEEAYKHFIDSFQPFMRGPMLMFNEKRSKTYDNICFLTGCGGSLQSVIYGFGGLRVGRAPEGFNQLLPGLRIKPCLPPKWKKLQITDIKWQGKRYDLTILPGNKWDLAERE